MLRRLSCLPRIVYVVVIALIAGKCHLDGTSLNPLRFFGGDAADWAADTLPPSSEGNGRSVAVIGAGFSGLTAALELRVKYGYDVTVYERLHRTGGRAAQFVGRSRVSGDVGASESPSKKRESTKKRDSRKQSEDSSEMESKAEHSVAAASSRLLEFIFDFGPSWWWFPDVFDRIFERYGGTVADYHTTQLLDPAYRIFIADQADELNPEATFIDVPGTASAFNELMAQRGRQEIANQTVGASAERVSLRIFNTEAEELYQKGIYDWIWKPMVSFREFVDPGLISAAFRLDLFNGFAGMLSRYVHEKWTAVILKWPVIFVGASPEAAPSMYRLMTYGGHMMGTWYPWGKTAGTCKSGGECDSALNKEEANGMRATIVGLERLAREKGIKFRLGADVVGLEIDGLHHDANPTNRTVRVQQRLWRSEPATLSGICYRKSGRTGSITNHLGRLDDLNQHDLDQETVSPKFGGSEDHGPVTCDRQHEGIVASADYRFVEQSLLPPELRQLDDTAYWESQAVFSPSVLLFYLGFGEEIPGLLHHNFFFDTDLDEHLDLTYAKAPVRSKTGQPVAVGKTQVTGVGAEFKMDSGGVREDVGNFTFYTCATSKTDAGSARVVEGSGSGENLFVLIPAPYTLDNEMERLCGSGSASQSLRHSEDEHRPESEECSTFWRNLLFETFYRMEQRLSLSPGSMKKSLVYQRHASTREFATAFHSARGNAFGLANTLSQSLILKPRFVSDRVRNLIFAGHLTNPGPGVPPTLVSGVVAGNLLAHKLRNEPSWLESAAAALGLPSDRLQEPKSEPVATSAADDIPSGATDFLYNLLFITFALYLIVYVAYPLYSDSLACSYALGVYLMWKNGKTYFAAATLMDRRGFLDTAAMYGLFRVADDFVDSVDNTGDSVAPPDISSDAVSRDLTGNKQGIAGNSSRNTVRGRNLERFVADFWKAWRMAKQTQENDAGSAGSDKFAAELRLVNDYFYSLHPILPAVIDASLRRSYPRQLFERFFRSMLIDGDREVRCRNYENLLEYIDGSAAVIGDFMLPILCPGLSIIPAEDLERALDAAPKEAEWVAPDPKSLLESTKGLPEQVEQFGKDIKVHFEQGGHQGNPQRHEILVKRAHVLRGSLLRTAQALGNGFQITNMIRDIDEDLTYNRVYMPEDLTQRVFGIDVWAREDNMTKPNTIGDCGQSADILKHLLAGEDVPEKHLKQLSAASRAVLVESKGWFASEEAIALQKKGNWVLYLEFMMRLADSYYAVAESGIRSLPRDTRDLIHFAAVAYRTIHEEIRGTKKWDIFVGGGGMGAREGRARVSSRKKLKLATQCVSKIKLMRILTLNLVCSLLLRVGVGLIPLACVYYLAVSPAYERLLALEKAKIYYGMVCPLMDTELGLIIRNYMGWTTGVSPGQSPAMTAVDEFRRFTYWQFHCIWIIPQIFLLYKALRATVAVREGKSDEKKLNMQSRGSRPIPPAVLPTNDVPKPILDFNQHWYMRSLRNWIAVMCAVAFTWTLPWDNYLVYRGVWGYPTDEGSGDSLLTIGWVPIAEYSFFILETVMVALLWGLMFPHVDELPLPPKTAGGRPRSPASSSCSSGVTTMCDTAPSKSRGNPALRRKGYLVLIIAFLTGVKLISNAGGLQFGERFAETEGSSGLYLGLILVWATPPLMIQWFFGAEALCENCVSFGGWMRVWVAISIYLAMSDVWALRNGCWAINPVYILPTGVQPFQFRTPADSMVLDRPASYFLPLEEAFFFAISALLCVWGLHLAMMISAVLHLNAGNKDVHGRPFGVLAACEAVHTWELRLGGEVCPVHSRSREMLVEDKDSEDLCLPKGSVPVREDRSDAAKAKAKSMSEATDAAANVSATSETGKEIGVAESQNSKAQSALSLWLASTAFSVCTALAGTAVVTAITTADGSISLQSQVLCLVMLVPMFGLPHGALDALVFLADATGNKFRSATSASLLKLASKFAVWLGWYLGLMAATYWLWTSHSVFALKGFLLLSIYHFGDGDNEWWEDVLQIVQRGNAACSVQSSPGGSTIVMRPAKFALSIWSLLKTLFGCSSVRETLRSVVEHTRWYLLMYVRGGMFLVAVQHAPLDTLRAFVPITATHDLETASAEVTQRHEEELFGLMTFLQHLYYVHLFLTIGVVLIEGLFSQGGFFGCVPASEFATKDVSVSLRIPILAQSRLTLRLNLSTLLLVEILVFYMLFRLCSPMLAFGVYFNFTHSLRHIVRVWWQIQFSTDSTSKCKFSLGSNSPGSSPLAGWFLTVMFVFTALSIVLGGLIFGFGYQPDTAWMSQYMRMIFIGLSMVTTPHLFVVYGMKN